MSDLETGYLQNLMSLEVHRVEFRTIKGKRKRLSQEECQIDDMKHTAWLTEEEAEAAPSKCGHCYTETVE